MGVRQEQHFLTRLTVVLIPVASNVFLPSLQRRYKQSWQSLIITGESINTKQPSELTAFDRNASLLGIQMKF